METKASIKIAARMFNAIRILIGLMALVFAVHSGKAQDPDYFEGSLTFKNYFKSDRLSEDSLNAANGSIGTYLYKGAFYKGMIFSDDTLVYVYNGKLSKCIFYNSKDRTTYCMDYSVDESERPKRTRVLKQPVNIKGHHCTVVETVYKNRVSRSYYTLGLKLDPDVYLTHAAYSYNKLMKLVQGGLLVRSEHFYREYTMISELVNIYPRKVDDEEFVLALFKNCKP
jgi:hypothetical protein